MSYQGAFQASARAIGGTTGSWNEDVLAAAGAELTAAELPVPGDLNGRMFAWLQLRLSSVNADLTGLLAEFRAAEPDRFSIRCHER